MPLEPEQEGDKLIGDPDFGWGHAVGAEVFGQDGMVGDSDGDGTDGEDDEREDDGNGDRPLRRGVRPAWRPPGGSGGRPRSFDRIRHEASDRDGEDSDPRAQKKGQRPSRKTEASGARPPD